MHVPKCMKRESQNRLKSTNSVLRQNSFPIAISSAELIASEIARMNNAVRNQQKILLSIDFPECHTVKNGVKIVLQNRKHVLFLPHIFVEGN